nr:10715_t:CDS:2 [Entrophospora candida]
MTEIYKPPNLPTIKHLSSTVQTLTQSFRDASSETLDFKNEFFESKISLIKKERMEFRSVATDITHQCDSLVKFGEELMIFIESHSDESVPNEDLLECLNDFLRVAKKNKTATETTQSKIKSLADNMKTVHDELVDFDLDNMENIDPKTYKNLKMTKVISTLACIMGAYVNLGATKKKEADKLSVVLSQNKKQMKAKLESLQDNSSLIHLTLRDIEGFWESRVSELERLIERFESFSKRESRPSKLFIRRFEEEWKEIIKEYKGCSRIIRKEIENDMK